jgi:hypothetical protein
MILTIFIPLKTQAQNITVFVTYRFNPEYAIENLLRIFINGQVCTTLRKAQPQSPPRYFTKVAKKMTNKKTPTMCVGAPKNNRPKP